MRTKYAIRTSLIFIGLVTLGLVIPKILISNNLESFTGEDKRYAQFALGEAKVLIGGSIEPLLVTRLRVAKVKNIDLSSKRKCGLFPRGIEEAVIIGEYRAIIELYTYFGLPYANVYVNCESSYIQRLIW